MYIGIINKCIETAYKSDYKLKIGAVVFKGKRILSTGYNSIRSSRMSNKHKNFINSLHAEQHALLNLDWSKLKGCSILVMKVSKTGKLSNAKPCPLCSKLLNHVGIKDIYYTNEQGVITNEKYDY